MRGLDTTLSTIRLGEEASLIVKPPNRPDDRDDVDAILVQSRPTYEFDDGELTYRVVEDEDRYRVLASRDVGDPVRVLGELRAVVNLSA
ncbi:hypothetical protein E6P09_02640 [Haloferax mediterranei ATCC 33500]|uniref:Uncharacterized protein n=1 Tax=Haloferax mediterranei (strain ATCC 33500 / DSM 1411 / JCM 8866 / NBRC 14739 / NCIMB 2177 / R-4) TaxID=523841 RepID=I3R8P6_HALMT|nr:hypothetical protein [Haloferax mediterranei]AFK20606.1 hypothetical protein HFX_2942 [Haloferax mediterranei ATCC 33500]AHZ22909.1 hypothetical protein BM92_09770 [Haloferax mediterranei ATCC 33500]EMA03076.1 hypothetical protein C439_10845 [Haloferax mediterranei ATCC 33500]MDX5987744.1 hypothetical protein [Haloferax mediterranei ATCC 33500]QCQ74224.1 hypothetical protein E6P09_02640 [Haloferax mediterranei ATCC 33500]